MVGIDVVEVERIKKAAQREHFLKRVYTQRELDYFKSKGSNMQTLAGMFCVKEAAAKALGSGLVFALTDVEVAHDESGAPRAVLHGKALRLLNGRSMFISISHTEKIATAVAFIV